MGVTRGILFRDYPFCFIYSQLTKVCLMEHAKLVRFPGKRDNLLIYHLQYQKNCLICKEEHWMQFVGSDHL